MLRTPGLPAGGRPRAVSLAERSESGTHRPRLGLTSMGMAAEAIAPRYGPSPSRPRHGRSSDPPLSMPITSLCLITTKTSAARRPPSAPRTCREHA